MEVTPPPKIQGLVEIQPKVFGDERGFFMESWSAERYEEAGLPSKFVQDNVSFSSKGVLRGLHFQNPDGQGKLVTVLQGCVYDVAVDVRSGSPTFGEFHGVELTGEKKNQFYVPPGFAHGFCVLSKTALFSYKCTDFYNPANEYSLLWDDPDVGIKWPIKIPSLSEKDREGRLLKDFTDAELPRF